MKANEHSLSQPTTNTQKGLEGPQHRRRDMIPNFYLRQRIQLSANKLSIYNNETHTHTELNLSPVQKYKVLGGSGVLYFYLTGLGGSKDG